MKIKIVIFALPMLLIFISPGCRKQKESAHSPPAQAAGVVDANDGNNQQQSSHTVFAYYFHRTIRCSTCLAIEALARETIEERFKDSIDKGALIWLPVNMEEAGGEEFVKKFELDAPTLVVSEVNNGKYVRWKKLEKVWQLVHDSEAFDAYVKDEVRQFLNE
jgi:hypothetical protein